MTLRVFWQPQFLDLSSTSLRFHCSYGLLLLILEAMLIRSSLCPPSSLGSQAFHSHFCISLGNQLEQWLVGFYLNLVWVIRILIPWVGPFHSHRTESSNLLAINQGHYSILHLWYFSGIFRPSICLGNHDRSDPHVHGLRCWPGSASSTSLRPSLRTLSRWLGFGNDQFLCFFCEAWLYGRL